MHGCKLSVVSIDALVPKHEAISIHSADKILIVLDWFHTEILQLKVTALKEIITFWKKNEPFA